jgi:hypothetical protein
VPQWRRSESAATRAGIHTAKRRSGAGGVSETQGVVERGPASDGMRETEASIANKISRETFSATFLLASLIAIKSDVIGLEDI